MNIEKLLSSVELPEDNLFQWDVEKNGTPEEAAITLRQQWKIWEEAREWTMCVLIATMDMMLF